MKKREFLKSACAGVCSCVGLTTFTSGAVLSQEKNDPNPEVERLKREMKFVHNRMAILIELISSDISIEQKQKLFKNLGRACSTEYMQGRFQNDLDGFLIHYKEIWAEDVVHDKENKTVTIIGRQTDNCACPLADKSVTPADFCDCSLGFLIGTFEQINGSQIQAALKESILRGGKRCSFTIMYS